MVILFRVSPLTAANYAIPAFLLSVLLSVASIGALGFFAFWTYVPLFSWDSGKLLSVSIRQGALVGLTAIGLLVFGMLGLLTLWTALLIIGVFVLIEIAVNA